MILFLLFFVKRENYFFNEILKFSWEIVYKMLVNKKQI